MSDSLPPQGLQHASPPFPSPTPGVYSNSYPLCWWCHTTISSSAIPFSSHLQCFPASGSFKLVIYMHQMANVLEFQLTINPSNEYSGLNSFRMDQLDLPAVQGTLNCLLQNHSSKASIPQCWAFFIFQLSHPYMTTRKTVALTRWTLVGKVISCSPWNCKELDTTEWLNWIELR